MLRDMPCGKDQAWHYQNPADRAPMLTARTKTRTWFGLVEADIPKPLWLKFEEMPPFFFTKKIPDEAVPQHRKDYMQWTG